MEMYLSTMLTYIALHFQRKEGTLILLPSAAILQSVMLHLEHYAVFFFRSQIPYLTFIFEVTFRYVMFCSIISG